VSGVAAWVERLTVLRQDLDSRHPHLQLFTCDLHATVPGVPARIDACANPRWLIHRSGSCARFPLGFRDRLLRAHTADILARNHDPWRQYQAHAGRVVPAVELVHFVMSSRLRRVLASLQSSADPAVGGRDAQISREDIRLRVRHGRCDALGSHIGVSRRNATLGDGGQNRISILAAAGRPSSGIAIQRPKGRERLGRREVANSMGRGHRDNGDNSVGGRSLLRCVQGVVVACAIRKDGLSYHVVGSARRAHGRTRGIFMESR